MEIIPFILIFLQSFFYHFLLQDEFNLAQYIKYQIENKASN